MTPPRQIYASAASRRTGRRWTRAPRAGARRSRRRVRRREPVLSAGLVAAAAALALVAGELLRGLG